MLNNFRQWARENIIKTLLGTAVLAATGGAGTYWAIYQDNINRIENMKVAEFNELVQEIKKFREGLNIFTEQLAINGVINAEKRSELSTSLVRLYSGLNTFSVNIPYGKEQPIKNLQSSINSTKKQIQLTNEKKDLDKLGVTLVNLFRDFEIAQPIIEEAVGKAFPSKA